MKQMTYSLYARPGMRHCQRADFLQVFAYKSNTIDAKGRARLQQKILDLIFAKGELCSWSQ